MQTCTLQLLPCQLEIKKQERDKETNQLSVLVPQEEIGAFQIIHVTEKPLKSAPNHLKP